MDFIFKKGHSGPVSELQQLGLISYGQYAPVLGDAWKIMETNMLRDEFWSKILGISTPFVCQHNGKVVGMALLIPHGNPDDIYDTGWCHIRMVGVHPDYAGNGIAKKLTQMCIEEAKQTGEKVIALHTSEFMDAARHIYEKLGFKVLREISPRFGKRYWLYTMDL